MPLPGWPSWGWCVADGAMRIDRYLWFVRLAKTRSAAQSLAAVGRLRIDGRVVDRAHAGVRIGNVLTFPLHGAVRVIRIEELPARRGPPAEARTCYVELTPGGDPGEAALPIGQADPD